MRTLLLSLFTAGALAACGGKSNPAPTPTPTTGEPDPATACNPEGPDGTPTTAEQCTCMGLEVIGDIGDGNAHCPDGMTEVSKIQYGIEGGVCCEQGDPAGATPEAS